MLMGMGESHLKSVTAVSVSLSPTLNEEDQRDFVALVDNFFDLTPSGKQLGPEWLVVIGVLKDTAIAIGAANAMVSLAKNINDWRKSKRAKGTNPAIIIHAKGLTLDLSEATDEEVTRFFEGEPPQKSANIGNLPSQ
jgi:hypothetical protein